MLEYLLLLLVFAKNGNMQFHYLLGHTTLSLPQREGATQSPIVAR